METKKMSIAQLKAKAASLSTSEALNAIRGGELTRCHCGPVPNIPPDPAPLPPMPEVPL